MPELVVTTTGYLADLAGAEKYAASPDECLYVTQRTGTCLLWTFDGKGEYYRELSEEDAVIWLVENDIEVPPGMLDDVQLSGKGDV